MLDFVDSLIKPAPSSLAIPDAEDMVVATPGMDSYVLKPVSSADLGWIEQLRELVMRPQVERIGPWETARQRRRFYDDLKLDHFRAISINGDTMGTVQVSPSQGGSRISLFYVHPGAQGRGVGGNVLRHLCWMADATGVALDLTTLKGARSATLYIRHRFAVIGDTAWETMFLRKPI